MAESQTVVTLRAKRDAIASAILNYERQLEQARADFAHITAALSIFEANDDPGSQRAYVSLFHYFKYGEVASLCRTALGNGARSTTDLAKHIMALKGLDTADKMIGRSVAFSVLRSLRGMARRGTVRCTRHRNRCVWALTPADGAASSLSTGATPGDPLLLSQSR